MYFLKAICPASGMEIVHSSPIGESLEEAQEAIDYQMKAMRQIGSTSYYQVVTIDGKVVYDPHPSETDSIRAG